MFLVVGQPGSEARLVADALDAHPDLRRRRPGRAPPAAGLPPPAGVRARAPPGRLAAELIVADKGFAYGIGAHLDADEVDEP